MPPKAKYSREVIVDSALEIAKEKGLAGITVRNVVKRLGCSVAPVYVNFPSVDDLVSAVVRRAISLAGELLAEQQGPNIFENTASAFLAFARSYPVLFRELLMRTDTFQILYQAVEQQLLQAFASEPAMSRWSLDERKRLALKMHVFQLGMSLMAVNGHTPTGLGDTTVEELLLEVGEDMYVITEIKRRK
jgi:AcrR family transcriptional regulator